MASATTPHPGHLIGLYTHHKNYLSVDHDHFGVSSSIGKHELFDLRESDLDFVVITF
jgi:hypothetical protein